MLQGLYVEEAAALRDAGLTLDEAVEALAPLPATGRIFFTTNDLEYLRHGGRIGRAAAATGSRNCSGSRVSSAASSRCISFSSGPRTPSSPAGTDR